MHHKNSHLRNPHPGIVHTDFMPNVTGMAASRKWRFCTFLTLSGLVDAGRVKPVAHCVSMYGVLLFDFFAWHSLAIVTGFNKLKLLGSPTPSGLD